MNFYSLKMLKLAVRTFEFFTQKSFMLIPNSFQAILVRAACLSSSFIIFSLKRAHFSFLIYRSLSKRGF